MGNFLLGLGIGMTAGLLFAPKSGSKTRDFLADKAGEGADYLTRQGEQLRDSASELFQRGRQAVIGTTR